MKTKLIDRVRLALGQNRDFLVSRDQLANTQGFTEAQFAEMGLEKRDLKKLERYGLARRGYINEGKGARVRWILVGNPVEMEAPALLAPKEADK